MVLPKDCIKCMCLAASVSYTHLVIRQTYYCQADTVVRNTLVDLQLIHKRTLKCKVYILDVYKRQRLPRQKQPI